MSDQDDQAADQQDDGDCEEWGPVEESEDDAVVGVKVMSTRPGIVSGGE